MVPQSQLRTLLLFVGITAGGVACSDPCGDLSHKVCACETTATRQQACRERVDATLSNASVTNAEEECCSQILDAETCNCSALADGNLAACGIAQEDDSEAPAGCLVPESVAPENQ